jgi:hypothetical protein
LNKKVVINKKELHVDFSGYYDSAIGDLLFTQVMCDVFMPGNDVVPIEVEKEQIRRVVEGFKKRPALYTEVRTEWVKGKSCYVISPRMRYDLEWLLPKPKVKLTKEGPVKVPAAAEPDAEPAAAEPLAPEFTDARRVFLAGKGFTYNPTAKNWTFQGIRFPDAMVDKPDTDDLFQQDMNRLIVADQNSRKRKPSRS